MLREKTGLALSVVATATYGGSSVDRSEKKPRKKFGQHEIHLPRETGSQAQYWITPPNSLKPAPPA